MSLFDRGTRKKSRGSLRRSVLYVVTIRHQQTGATAGSLPVSASTHRDHLNAALAVGRYQTAETVAAERGRSRHAVPHREPSTVTKRRWIDGLLPVSVSTDLSVRDQTAETAKAVLVATVKRQVD